MRTRMSTSILALLLTVALISGCAPSRVANGPVTGEGSSTMRVLGVPPIGSLTIYLLTDIGARRLVGYVSPGQEAQLRFNVPEVGNYRFVAQTVGGDVGLSNIVRLRPGDSVRWDLTTNIALVDER